MPLTSAPGRVEASPMEGGKAMANTAQIAGGPQGGPGWLVIESPDLELTRNAVMQEALGGRTWIGALGNLTGRPRTDVAVQIRFHDRRLRPVGSPVSARAGWLAPGAGLHLQARLPVEATGLRIVHLRWTAGGRPVEIGPCDPRPFGDVED